MRVYVRLAPWVSGGMTGGGRARMAPLAEAQRAQAVQVCKGHAQGVPLCARGVSVWVCGYVCVGWVCAPVCGRVQGCGEG